MPARKSRDLLLVLVGLVLFISGVCLWLMANAAVWVFPRTLFFMNPPVLLSLGIALLISPLVLATCSQRRRMIALCSLVVLSAVPLLAGFISDQHVRARFKAFEDGVLSIANGMTREEVDDRLLGFSGWKRHDSEPDQNGNDGTEWWRYKGVGWQYADFQFDDSGKVLDKFYDY